MLRDIDSVSFQILDPDFRNGARGIGIGRCLSRFLDRLYAFHLESEVVNSPRVSRRADESDIDESVRKINGTVRLRLFSSRLKTLL